MMPLWVVAMKELKIPTNLEKRSKASLTIDADAAGIIRRIAYAEGRARNLSALVNDMIQVYVAEKHPDWTIEET